MRQISYNKGKIRLPILVATLVILVFFTVILWIKDSTSNIPIPNNPVGTPIEPTGTIAGNSNTSTATTSVPIPPPIKPVINVGHVFGIAAGGGLYGMSTSTLNAELDQMVALGVQWVRFDVEWGHVQYNGSNDFTWNGYDTIVKALNAHNLHGLGIIVFTPVWARNPSCTGGAMCPPGDPSTYAKFASEVAARYKNFGMHDWEIWNEPNNYDFWATKTDCKAYANLLKVTYPAIKKADPTAVVITGGLAPEATDNHNISQIDFLNCVYQNGGQGYFDAVGDHPYSFPQIPSAVTQGAWAQMSQTTPSLRSIMIANGDAEKKIWITEFGTPTNGPDPHWYVSEGGQAQMANDAFQLYKNYTWAGPFFWYTFKDSGTSTDTNENFFGLTRADESAKPVYTTIQNILSNGL